MATTAHLIKLSGMGDTCWKLLDTTDWGYFVQANTWRGDGAEPAIPESTRQTATAHLATEGDYCTVEELLRPDWESGSAANDLALTIPPSRFGGESFYTYSPTIKDLMAFAAKHDLDIEESYDGCIY